MRSARLVNRRKVYPRQTWSLAKLSLDSIFQVATACVLIIFHLLPQLGQRTLPVNTLKRRLYLYRHGIDCATVAYLQVCCIPLSPSLTSALTIRLTNLLLFHRIVDPIFAICVGVSAAVLRIQREEREKYPDEDSSPAALWHKGVRMTKSYYGYEIKTEK